MKPCRVGLVVFVAALAVIFIVQLSSSFSFGKSSEDKGIEKHSQPDPARILSSRRYGETSTSSTKNYSRKLQYAFRRNMTKKAKAKRQGFRLSSRKHFCWEKEEFHSVGKCLRCSSYEKRVSPACQVTGNKQLVLCVVSKRKEYKSCPHVKWIEERNFWTFEGTVCVLLIFSSLSVWQRNKKLDAIYQEKLRQKVASDL